MTKDFKQSGANSKANKAGILWMISGIAIGLIAGLGMYYFTSWQPAQTLPHAESGNYNSQSAPANADNNSANQGSKQNQTGPANTSNTQEQIKDSKKTEDDTPDEDNAKRANFSYYAVLPNLELDVRVKPREQIENTPSTSSEQVVSETVKTTKPSTGDFILQLASLKDLARAQRAQEDLQNRGLQISLQETSVKGKRWYRLLAGPVSTERDLKALKQQVGKLGFKPIVIKVK